MVDSYGDGWNGASLDLYVNDVLIGDDLTIDDGDEASFEFDVEVGDDIHTTWTSGAWDGECAYAFYNAAGELVAESDFDLLCSFTVWPSAVDVFFSEHAEGSSYNKYLEIYNNTGADYDMHNLSLSSCSNGCDEEGEFDYPDNVTFAEGTIVAAGDVFVVAHPDADAAILAEADYTDFIYLTNGDDAFAITLAGATADNYTIVDIVGDMGGDPGDGWDVAGITNGTKDHTLVRKSSVAEGNEGDWSSSAGSNEEDSEWIVLDNNTWDYLGSHPHVFGGNEPSISILSPEEGATLFSDQVTIEFSVANFNIGSDGDGVDGHIHYALDDNNAVMHYSTEPITISNVSEGDHQFHIWLVDSNHEPVDPFAGDTLSFNVSEAGVITAIYDIQYVEDPDSDDASPLNGEEVTIHGVVTAEFWGSDQFRYMNVQDDDGPWDGIVLSLIHI